MDNTTNKVSFLHSNYLEFHYQFNDDSHSMNAFVFNKCEGEILAVVRELSLKLKVNIEIETEPLENGGLRSWLKIKSKSDKVTIKDLILIAAIGGLMSNIMTSPLTTAISEITKNTINLLFEDDEITKLKELKEKKQLQLDIFKIENELKIYSSQIDENVITKRRSNYYSTLKEYSKIENVSIALEDDNKQISFEQQIDKKDFNKFVLESDELDPIVESNAVIEVVSPVLKKGKYKWTGIYKDDVIQFNMKSTEFKTLVQTGQIVFKNGFTFECELQINKKVTNEGIVINTSYDVLLVNQYYDNDNPIETPEGKRNRQKQEADKRQLEFSFKQ